jgi:hypothetical protein
VTADPLVFLHATLDAAQNRAEAGAERAWSPHWEYDYMVHEIRDLNNGNTLANLYFPEIGAHVEANDPAAVLRLVAGHRKQLSLHAAVPDHGRFSERTCAENGCDGEHNSPPVCRSCRNYAGDPIEAPCDTVEILAEGWGWTEEATDADPST